MNEVAGGRLHCHPPDALVFPATPERGAKVQLALSWDGRACAAYRVMLNRPKRYIVRPAVCGLLPPAGAGADLVLTVHYVGSEVPPRPTDRDLLLVEVYPGIFGAGAAADGLSADGLSADADGLSADGLSADGLSADGLSARIAAAGAPAAVLSVRLTFGATGARLPPAPGPAPRGKYDVAAAFDPRAPPAAASPAPSWLHSAASSPLPGPRSTPGPTPVGTPAPAAPAATAAAPPSLDVSDMGVPELLAQVDALNVENARLRSERDELVRQRDAARLRLRGSNGRTVVSIRDGHAEIRGHADAVEERDRPLLLQLCQSWHLHIWLMGFVVGVVLGLWIL